MPTFDVQKARRDGLDDATIQRMIQLTGATPSEPIGPAPQAASQPRHATAAERFRLSFGDAQGREQFMQQRGIQEGMVNKPGFDLGDITSKAGGLLPILGATAGGAAALPAAAAIGAGTAGVGAPAALGIGSAGMGLGAAAGEGLRQGIGELLGVRKNTSSTEGAKDVAVEGTLGALGPLANKATVTLGRPVLRAVKDKAANLFIKSLDPTSRQLRSGAISTDDAKDWISRGFKGTIQGMAERAQQVIQTNRPVVNSYIEKNADKVVGTADELLEPLGKLESQATGLPKRMRAAVQRYAEDVIDTVGNAKGITLKQADEMRYNLDRALTKFYQSADEAGETAIEKQSMLGVSNKLREMVNKNLPENFNGQDIRAAREAIHSASKLARALWLRETKVSRGDKAATIGVSALGSLLGFGVAGGAGAVAGGAVAGTAARLAQQAPVRTGLASLLQPAVSGAGRAIQAIPEGVRQRALTPATQGIMRLLDSR